MIIRKLKESKSNTMMPYKIHPAFLRDSEKKEIRKAAPHPGAQVWIYTGPGVERKLATVLDPKMIDSRILASITIPPNAIFTARFNKENPLEERRLREWPDDSKYSPDEYISVLNGEDWQWYFTEPRLEQKEVEKQLDVHLERIKFQNEIINNKKKEIKELKEMMLMERKCMQYELDDAEHEINTLKKENKEMTGNLVKVKWVIEHIQKVKGFTDTGEAIAESFEYIDFPELSEIEKEEFVPSSVTNTVDATTLQEDREFYGEDFYQGLPQSNEGPSVETPSILEGGETSETPVLQVSEMEPVDGIPDIDDVIENPSAMVLTQDRSRNLQLLDILPDVLFEGWPQPSERNIVVQDPDGITYITGSNSSVNIQNSTTFTLWLEQIDNLDVVSDHSTQSQEQEDLNEALTIPYGPELPWYEIRYPTNTIEEAARVIQRHYRSLYV